MTATLLDMTTDLWPDHWGITPSEKIVLEQLGKRADEETDDCFVGLKYIMRRSGLSEDTVRRCIKSLRDKGWLSIKPQERASGATSANRYLLNFNKIVNAHIAQRDIERDERAARFPGKPEGPPHGATLPPSTVRGAPPHGAGGKLPDSITTNSHSAQARDDFDSAVMEAAGDAADSASPGIIATYPLWVLLSGEKPCTVEEVVEGVKKAAAWYAKRNLTGKMRNWDTAVQMACEFRDARITGHPVKEAARPAQTGYGDPAGFDHDRWRVLITRVLPRQGGDWPGSLGPPPGEEGSLVPADLVDLWKGKAA